MAAKGISSKSTKKTGQTADNSAKTSGTKASGSRTSGTNSRNSAQSASGSGKSIRTIQTKAPVKSLPNPSIQEREPDGMNNEIILLVVLAFSILLLLSNFNLCGAFGRFISNMMYGLFGLPAFLFPFVLFFGTAFVLSNKGSRRAFRKTFGAVTLWISITSLIQLFGRRFDPEMGFLDYYKVSAEHRTGGGLLGGIICKLFCPFFGTVGTYVILVALVILCLMLLTGKALFAYITSVSEETIQRKKEERQHRLREETEYSNNAEEDEYEEPSGSRYDKSSNSRRVLTSSGNLEERRPARTVLLKRPEPEVLKDDMHELHPADEIAISGNYIPDGDLAREVNEIYEEELREKFGGKKDEIENSDVISDSQRDDNKEIRRDSTYVDERFDIDSTTESFEEARTSSSGESFSDPVPATSVVQLPTAPDVQPIEQLKIQKEYVFPSIELLSKPKANAKGTTESELKETATKLQKTLESFGVRVSITNVSCGPAVTRYELQPEQGVKVSRITSLADDIKLNLAAADVRIEAPIPGKAAVGIEVPNKTNTAVMLRELIESSSFKEHPSDIAFAVGKDIGGQTVVTDIARMPHLLIAGQTGSGKSVCINTLIMSILYKAKPSDVRLIMVDPKVVELSVYNGIPHLLIPVVTDPKKASAALNWAVMEMTDRYQKFAELGVRDLKGYNDKVASIEPKQDDKYPRLPQIVIIVDELADLMMVAPGEVEDAICRLAQMARAAGLHLIIATQRPSVNVITGLIKANIPSRIAFSVSSAIDSRTILDGSGAEKLLGKGDMLFFPSGYPKPVRIQGAFVSDKEVSAVVDFLKNENQDSAYSADVSDKITNGSLGGDASSGGSANERDDYFIEAGKFIIEKDKASIGMLQRVYKIGFNRAARIMDQLAEAGVVGPEEGTKPRKILMSLEEFEQYVDEYV